MGTLLLFFEDLLQIDYHTVDTLRLT